MIIDTESPILALRATPDFRAAAGLELLTALDGEEDVVYALDADLRLVFSNLAWWRYARANGGEQCLDDYGLGASVRGVVPDTLRRFYDEAFGSVLVGGPPVDHEYRCPTPTEHRMFRMRVVRLGPTGQVDPSDGGTAFLVVSNQLVRTELEGEGRALASSGNAYLGPEGIVVMCAHCRRCRRCTSSTDAAAVAAATSTTWDWVPSYVETPPAAVSHGLCATCFAHHYPD